MQHDGARQRGIDAIIGDCAGAGALARSEDVLRHGSMGKRSSAKTLVD